MKNLNSCAGVLIFVAFLATITVTMGRLCYKTMPKGGEAIWSIVQCKGSCVIQSTSLEGPTYWCSNTTQATEHCVQNGLAYRCYCNRACVRMLDTSSFINLFPVLHKPETDRQQQQLQHQHKPQPRKRMFYPFIKNVGLDNYK